MLRGLLFGWLWCAALAAQSAPVEFVAGRPVVRVTMTAGEASYECHLLVDLGRTAPLFLHNNAARSLGALSCTVKAGELELADVPVDGGGDRWLEGFTAAHAEALHEVPLAGYLGLGAFAGRLAILDGPAGRLELRDGNAGQEPPPATPTLASAPLTADPRERGVRFEVELGDDRRATALLHSKEDFSAVAPGLATELGAATGRLKTARVGAVDLAARTPFRPAQPASGVDLLIGGRVLAQLRTTLALDAGWIAFEATAEPTYPEDEAAFYAARFGPSPREALAGFVADHPDSPFRAEAAKVRLAMVAEGLPLPDELAAAAGDAIEAAAPNARARQALEILDGLPPDPTWSDVRRRIAEAGLEHAEADADGTAGHQLRVELGRVARADGRRQDARRHLLSAVFGMRGDGPANLELGRLYEDSGELERARSRYLIALLDMEDTGADGLLALQRVHTQLTGSPAGLQQELAELAEGRIPALHPIPREPEEVNPTGKVVLAELFTGAMCPPCAAADVAFDALGDLYRDDEVALIQWHLPIPAPEPMVSAAAQGRGRTMGIRGTPTLILDGHERVSGGGKADQAPRMLGEYRQRLAPLLAAEPTATIIATARIDANAVVLSVHAGAEGDADLVLRAVLTERVVVFPGRNGILFHHRVARCWLTPEAGVPIAKASAATPFETSRSLLRITDELEDTVAAFEGRGRFRIRPVSPDPSQLQVVLWLERRGDGHVVQAASVDATREP